MLQSTHMLYNCLIRRRFYLDSLFQKPVEKFAPMRRSASVEPKSEFVKVIVQMVMAHGTLMCTHQPSFQQRGYSMNSWEQIRWRFAASTEVDHCMTITLGCQAGIASPCIRNDFASQFSAGFDKSVQTIGRSIGNPFHSDTANSFSIYLRCNSDHGFILHLSATQTLLQPAKICFINFNLSAQAISTWPNHCTPDFVEQSPSCFIASQAQYSLQTKCACSVFLTGNPPDSSKPQTQGTSASLKNSAAGNRHLVIACAALQKSSLNRPRLFTLTPGAFETRWPAERKKIFPARFIRRKTLFKFHKCFGVVFHTPANYMLGLPESRGYPLHKF